MLPRKILKFRTSKMARNASSFGNCDKTALSFCSKSPRATEGLNNPKKNYKINQKVGEATAPPAPPMSRALKFVHALQYSASSNIEKQFHY